MKNLSTIEKMKKSKLGKPAVHSTGDKNWRWKGGITPLRMKIWTSFKSRQWRSDILSRDDFTCQECGKKGCRLEVHHIKRFAIILEEYKIVTLQQALECDELWNINNGTTLCIDCHNKTKGWYNKKLLK